MRTVKVLVLGHPYAPQCNITSWSRLVADMIKAKVMHDHAVPIALFQFRWEMSCNIVIHFSEVLNDASQYRLFYITFVQCSVRQTETKKLEVPSAREKIPGKSFNQVSSPYITSFPPGLSFNCNNQVSWFARLEVVSDSAKFSMTSRKEGIDPVVIALTRGMVIVGEVA